MDLGFDPLALAVSIVAVWYTINESRKSNKVIVEIIKFDNSTRMSVEHPEPQRITKVLVKNYGITLYDPILVINYQSPDLFNMTIPLVRRNLQDKPSEFARGMIAEFGLDDLEDEQTRWMVEKIDSFETFEKCSPRLVLYSQGFWAATFIVFGRNRKLHDVLDWIYGYARHYANRDLRKYFRKLNERRNKNRLDLAFSLYWLIRRIRRNEFSSPYIPSQTQRAKPNA